jgi:RNA polymerase sigma factor (sigma-70 family)
MHQSNSPRLDELDEAITTANDGVALEWFWNEYYGLVRHVVAKLVISGNVGDICHETLLKACIRRSTYDPKRGELSSWVARIAVNTVIDWYRKQREQLRHDLDEQVKSEEESGFTPRHFDVLEIAVSAALLKMSQMVRGVFEGRYLLEKPNNVVARELGFSDAKATRLWQEAVEILRVEFRRIGFDLGVDGPD